VKGSYDHLPVEFKSHDISVVTPKHLLESIEVSADYNATLIVMSDKMVSQMRQHASYRNFLIYHRNPSFHLDDRQYESIMNLSKLMQSASMMHSDTRQSIKMHLLEITYMFIDEYRFDNHPEERSTNSTLFMQFYDNLTEHYRESREVKFYSKLLCLSPKYFSTVIRQETGTSASRWIADYVVMRAKQLLAHNGSKSIQQISQELGFPDQATFARYFKTNTGMPPREFRDKKHKVRKK
jgi:AraC-like DNA-binding protein